MMIRSQVDRQNWTMFSDGEPMLLHTPQQPFFTMIRLEKEYTSNRGSVKTTVVERERIPLTDVESRGEDTVVLSGGGHRLTVTATPCEGGAVLILLRGKLHPEEATAK